MLTLVLSVSAITLSSRAELGPGGSSVPSERAVVIADNNNMRPPVTISNVNGVSLMQAMRGKDVSRLQQTTTSMIRLQTFWDTFQLNQCMNQQGIYFGTTCANGQMGQFPNQFPNQQCQQNPSLPGCQVNQFPNQQCQVNPTLPGCPQSPQCQQNPNSSGCQMFPNQQCQQNPSMPGCQNGQFPNGNGGVNTGSMYWLSRQTTQLQMNQYAAEPLLTSGLTLQIDASDPVFAMVCNGPSVQSLCYNECSCQGTDSCYLNCQNVPMNSYLVVAPVANNMAVTLKPYILVDGNTVQQLQSAGQVGQPVAGNVVKPLANRNGASARSWVGLLVALITFLL